MGLASPVRSCVVTRTTAHRSQLLRFVVDPAGRLMEDLTGRFPGRAIYVQPKPEHVTALLKRRTLLRGWGQKPVSFPEEQELLQRLDRGLSRRLLDGIGLARRAKQAWVGVDYLATRSQQDDRPLLVLLAGDVSEHTREKVMRLLRRFPHAGWMALLDRDRLGGALGENLVATVAITGQSFVERITTDAVRWLAFNGSAAVVAHHPSCSPVDGEEVV
ncbi:MAG: DUF448 domain-containing protein [Magnetococcales bacterium]|nr:DUF448 domain-containing protein [Magnetococcales bacterium]